MAWKDTTKRVRGIARYDTRSELAPTFINVVFDEPFFFIKTGDTAKGKTYDSMEEAIEELGAKTVRRVLEKKEEVSVTVEVETSEWV